MIAGKGRRSAPAVVWLMLGCMGMLAVVSVGLGVLVVDRQEQVQSLHEEVSTLRVERQMAQARLDAMQGTATAMEDRIRALEASDPGEQLAALQEAVRAAPGSQPLAALRATMAGIQARLDSVQAGLDGLAEAIDAQAASGSGGRALPVEVRLDVARQRQTHNLSCESSAASMAAHYHGVALGEEDVLAALPRNENPHLGFRGNVDGPTGGIEDYGVYAGPIMSVLEGSGLRVRQVAGGLSGIRAAIARGNPVIAWITYNCGVSTPIKQIIDGQEVTLVPNQHAVVVTGYNADGFWCNDPWDGEEDFYGTDDFRRAMSYFGDMALEVGAP